MATTSLPARRASTVQRVFHGLGGGKGEFLRRSDFDLLSIRRGAAFSLGREFGLELSKSCQRDFLARNGSAHDALQHVVEDWLRLRFCHAGGRGGFCNKIG